MLFFDLLAQTLRGKSLSRSLLNLAIKKLDLRLSGTILDLGSGSRRPSYFRFINLDLKAKVISIDINPDNKPVTVADISKSIPYAKNSIDFCFLINTVYLLQNPGAALNNCAAVLKKGGQILINFPLIWPIVNEPKDYWRFTDNAVKILLKGVDLKIEKMIFYGGRITSALSLVDNHLPTIFRVLLHPLALLGDKMFSYFVTDPSPCPIGTLVLATKI